MAKGDIILINFPFTDLSDTKLRPAVVLLEGVSDITVCFITSRLEWRDKSDMILDPSAENGLRKQSLIRVAKIATLDKSLAKGLLGNLTPGELVQLNRKLKELFQL